MLRYNTLTKQCIRSFLNETFIPIRVSPTARFIGTHVIGTNAIEQFGLTVNIWSDNLGADGNPRNLMCTYYLVCCCTYRASHC